MIPDDDLAEELARLDAEIDEAMYRLIDDRIARGVYKAEDREKIFAEHKAKQRARELRRLDS